MGREMEDGHLLNLPSGWEVEGGGALYASSVRNERALSFPQGGVSMPDLLVVFCAPQHAVSARTDTPALLNENCRWQCSLPHTRHHRTPIMAIDCGCDDVN